MYVGEGEDHEVEAEKHFETLPAGQVRNLTFVFFEKGVGPVDDGPEPFGTQFRDFLVV